MPSRHRYFPVNASQKDWGLYVTCAGRSRSEPGSEFPLRAHPDEYYFSWERGRVLKEWQLVLVEEGRGEAETDGRRFVLVPGSLLVLAPGRWHRYRPDPATGWTTCWLGFGGDLAERIAQCTGFGPVGGTRDLSGMASGRKLFDSAVADILRDGQTHPCAAAARLHTLLAALAENRQGGEERTRREEIVRQAQAHIAEHLAETLDLEGLAAAFGLPYRTFRYIFAAECGMPPHRWQLQVRLERARRLLESSDIPVAEIASLLGFRSTWYFAHFFQRQTGCSATQYRATHHAK